MLLAGDFLLFYLPWSPILPSALVEEETRVRVLIIWSIAQWSVERFLILQIVENIPPLQVII